MGKVATRSMASILAWTRWKTFIPPSSGAATEKPLRPSRGRLPLAKAPWGTAFEDGWTEGARISFDVHLSRLWRSRTSDLRGWFCFIRQGGVAWPVLGCSFQARAGGWCWQFSWSTPLNYQGGWARIEGHDMACDKDSEVVFQLLTLLFSVQYAT